MRLFGQDAVVGNAQKIIPSALVKRLAFHRGQLSIAVGGVAVQIAFKKWQVISKKLHPNGLLSLVHSHMAVQLIPI